MRDGNRCEAGEAPRTAGIVMVGGGVEGLSAAYFLRGKDWLLLEKEDHFGGNAYQEEFDGQPYGTGSAYAERGDYGDQLASAIGLHLPFVNSPDPTIVNKTFVPDSWKTGLDQLPYPNGVRESFKKFRDDMRKINVRGKMAELDSQPFTSFTGAYAPEVQQCCDGLGPSIWDQTAETTTALLGVANVQYLLSGGDSKRVILPGGLASLT